MKVKSSVSFRILANNPRLKGVIFVQSEDTTNGFQKTVQGNNIAVELFGKNGENLTKK